MLFLSHIWLIPLLPAFGAAVMFFFAPQDAEGSDGRRMVGNFRSRVSHGLRRGFAIFDLVIDGGALPPALSDDSLHLARHRHRPHELCDARWFTGRASG